MADAKEIADLIAYFDMAMLLLDVEDEAPSCQWETDGVPCGEPAAWRLILHCCGNGNYLLCEDHAGAEKTQLQDGGMVHFPCDADITSWTWMRVGE